MELDSKFHASNQCLQSINMHGTGPYAGCSIIIISILMHMHIQYINRRCSHWQWCIINTLFAFISKQHANVNHCTQLTSFEGTLDKCISCTVSLNEVFKLGKLKHFWKDGHRSLFNFYNSCVLLLWLLVLVIQHLQQCHQQLKLWSCASTSF